MCLLLVELCGNDEMLRDDRIFVQDEQVAGIGNGNIRDEQV